MPSSPSAQGQSSRLLIVGGILLLIVTAVGLAAWKFAFIGRGAPDSNDPTASSGFDPEAPGLTILVSGDTAGWIVPCGCASGQSGGLLRRGTFVTQEKIRHATVVVDAGGAPAGTALYDRLKFATILNGEMKMGIQAHNIGGPELALGLAELTRLHTEIQIPFVSANLRDLDGNLVFEACRIVTSNGRRMAFIGVLSQRYADSKCRIDEPRDAILAALEQHKGRFDWAIVLAYLPEAELRELAAALPEVHAVVGGPTGQSIAPVTVGPVLLASATNKGKFLVKLSVPEPNAKTPFSGESVELTESFSDDASQADILTEFRRELDLRDLSAAESGLAGTFAKNLPPDYQLAGSATCRECHRQDDDHWKQSSHSKAWETLIHRDAQMDSYCQQCHTTGFGLPGGFQSSRTTRDRISVGCESCHGPSRAHVERPAVKTPFVAHDQCIRCHDHENSPQFDPKSYWLKVKHGESKATTGQ